MRRSSAVLAAWTLVVWGGRIRNALDGDEGAGAVVLAMTFVVLAAVVLATRARAAVAVLVGWTSAVWVVRIVDIAAFSDRGAAFVAVHAVLAAVSIALAAWAGRDLSRRARAPVPAA